MFDSKWYYFEPETGAMASGWKQIGDKWYYLNPVMQTSWMRLGGKLYYFNADGSMQLANTRFYVNSFAYETDGTGAIKRNTTEDKGDGRIFIYEDDGKMKYKNNTTQTGNHAGGTDVYVYLMEGDLNEQVKNDTKQAIADAIADKKEELFDEYKEKVSTVYKSTKRANRRTKWEEKVRRSLSDLSATETEIAEFIYQVEIGNYGNEEYNADYDNDDDELTRRLFDYSELELKTYQLKLCDLSQPGQVYRVNVTDRITIGRKEHCMVCIPNSTLSGEHCEIVLKNGRLYLHDLNSTNGTFLNGNPARVTEEVLGSGSIIEMGAVKLQVRITIIKM